MRRKSLSILVLLLAVLLAWFRMGHRASNSQEKQTGTASRSSQEFHLSPLHFSSALPLSAENKIGSVHTPSPFRVISCTPEETLLEFTLPGYTVEYLDDEDGRKWADIKINGADCLDIAGKPSLPTYQLAYGAIPGSNVSIELRDIESDQLTECRPLPGRGPILRDQEPPEWIPSEETYGHQAETTYPSQNAYVVSTYQIRDVQGSGILFTPFQYNAAENTVQVVTHCVVALRSDSPLPASLSTQADFAQMQRTAFVNSESFRSDVPSTVGSLSILVPDAWSDSEVLAEFVEWKESIGWTVDVANYPADTGEGRDNILAWSQQRYAEGMTHLLLLGDYAFIPPWKNGKQESTTYANVATDTPYALLAGEGDFSYMDVFMGRIPVHTLDFLENALRSSIYYEHGAYQNQSWTQTGLYIGSSEKASYWPYAAQTDASIIQLQAAALDEAGVIQRDISTELYARALPSYNPPTSAVTNAINAGASVLLYLGHGSCTHFTTTGFASVNARKLNNQGMLPFVIAPVCSSGNLDHYSASKSCPLCQSDATYHSLGQTFFENQNMLGGVVGTVLSSNLTYWNPPIRQVETFTADLGNNQSAERLTTQGAYALDSLNAAVRFCDTYADEYNKAGKPGYKGSYNAETGIFHAWEMALYGDPSAVLHIGPQAPLSIAFSLKTDGSAELLITGFSAEDPRPVPNCAVCIETQDGSVSGRTDANGIFILPDASSACMGMSVKILDGSGPYLEKEVVASVDANGDGVVTNRELSNWLAIWQTAFNPESENAGQMLAVREQAIAEWQAKPDVPQIPNESPANETQPPAEFSEVTPGTAPALSYDAICEVLNHLCHDYWPHIRSTTIGASVNGTPISGLRISLAEENENVPNLLLLAGVHGDEPESITQLMGVVDTFVKGLSGKDAGSRQWLESCVVWVIPVLNPDGYSLGTHGNVHGVDLADGFPTSCGTLANNDPTQLYIPWNYTGTQHLPEIEQKSFVRWMIAHSIHSVMEVRQGDRYVSYSGAESETLAYFLANFVGYLCDDSKAGTLLDWISDYLECQVLAVSAPEAEDEAYEVITNWIANANQAAPSPGVPRLYLPACGKEIPVALADAGQTPVMRVFLPSGWQAEGRGAECIGIRQGDGYVDVALASENPITDVTICVKADEDIERETRLDFTLDTPTTQSSWQRVMVAPTYANSTTISLHEGWNMLAVPIEGITPDMLGISEVYLHGDNGFVKCSPDTFLPGRGYWVKCNTAGFLNLPGWHLDPRPLTLKKGIHLLGTTFPHTLAPNELLYEETNGVYQLLPDSGEMPANRAVWRYVPQDTILVP